MGKFFQYPVKHEFVVKKDYSFVINENSEVAFKILDDPTAAKARYIAACLNACKGMDTATLESGAPGWIAENLANGEQAFDTLLEAQKLLHAVKSDNLELQKQLQAEKEINKEFRRNFRECAEHNVKLDSENKRLQEVVSDLSSFPRTIAEYRQEASESALNELRFFGQKMYNAICEIVQNAPFDSKFDLEKIVQDGERFFAVKAPMKKIETIKDLRDVIESASEYFDTEKVSLVDGILRIGEHPTEPAYFVGHENGIEDTDAPPDNGGYTDAEVNCEGWDAQPRDFCRPRGYYVPREQYKKIFGEYPDGSKNQ
jgi:hypothetical protein